MSLLRDVSLRTATRLRLGTVAVKSSSHLPLRSVPSSARPVTFPTGCAMLLTNPTARRSDVIETIGTVVVASFAASAAKEPEVTKISIRWAISSRANAGKRSRLAAGVLLFDDHALAVDVPEIPEPNSEGIDERMWCC